MGGPRAQSSQSNCPILPSAWLRGLQTETVLIPFCCEGSWLGSECGWGRGPLTRKLGIFQHLLWMGCMERSPRHHRTAAGSVNESKQGQPQAMNFVSNRPDNRAWDQLCKLGKGLRRWGLECRGSARLTASWCWNLERWPRCQVGGGSGRHSVFYRSEAEMELAENTSKNLDSPVQRPHTRLEPASAPGHFLGG